MLNIGLARGAAPSTPEQRLRRATPGSDPAPCDGAGRVPDGRREDSPGAASATPPPAGRR